MRENVFLIIGLLLFACQACNNKSSLSFTEPSFVHSRNLKGKVLVDSFVMGMCTDLDYHNGILFVVGYTGAEEEKLHLFSAENGQYIKSLYPSGRGPGEAVSMLGVDVDFQTGKVCFYDAITGRLHSFQLDSVIRHSNLTNDLFSCPYPYMVQILNKSGSYIGVGGLRKSDGQTPRVVLFNNDSIVNEYYDYPAVQMPMRDGIKIGYQFAHYEMSPKGDKMVCASIYGAILEFFSLERNRIELDRVVGFIKPVYTTDKNGFFKLLPEQTVFGFLDLCVTDNYIYTIYCGDTNTELNNQVAVFDWKGRGVCLYKTDYHLECICVNDEEDKMYATAIDDDGEKIIVEFKL